MNDTTMYYNESPSEKNDDAIGTHTSDSNSEGVASAKIGGITTGHALTIHVINLLAEHRSLVSTVSLSQRKDGSTMLTFETHAEETK